jgi:hypothetical protein
VLLGHLVGVRAVVGRVGDPVDERLYELGTLVHVDDGEVLVDCERAVFLVP